MKSEMELKTDVALAAAEITKIEGSDGDVAWRRYLEAHEAHLKEKVITDAHKDLTAERVLFLRELIRGLSLAKSGPKPGGERARSRPTPAPQDFN